MRTTKSLVNRDVSKLPEKGFVVVKSVLPKDSCKEFAEHCKRLFCKEPQRHFEPIFEDSHEIILPTNWSTHGRFQLRPKSRKLLLKQFPFSSYLYSHPQLGKLFKGRIPESFNCVISTEKAVKQNFHCDHEPPITPPQMFDVRNVPLVVFYCVQEQKSGNGSPTIIPGSHTWWGPGFTPSEPIPMYVPNQVFDAIEPELEVGDVCVMVGSLIHRGSYSSCVRPVGFESFRFPTMTEYHGNQTFDATDFLEFILTD